MLNAARMIVSAIVITIALATAGATPSQAQAYGAGWGAPPAYASFCWGYARPSYYNPGWVYIAPLPPRGYVVYPCFQVAGQPYYVGRRAFRKGARPL
jgi:hypothetical protein